MENRYSLVYVILSSIFKRLFRYVFIIIKYCYVVYTLYVTKDLMNFYLVEIKI